MDQQDIHYALAKQVPDMRSRGFIVTALSDTEVKQVFNGIFGGAKK